MKHTSIFRIYLALASFVWLIGAVIGYGNIGYEYAKSKIISDEEYVIGSRSYEMKGCEEPIYPNSANTVSIAVKERIKPRYRTQEEIDKCKIEARDRAIQERRYQLKDTVIGGGVWGTLFLLVFLIHFPFLLKSNKREER